MIFGFMSEGDIRPGESYSRRYFDLVDEVLLAERVGFDVFGCSEQHFPLGASTTSAPEVIYSYLISRTSRIRFRYLVTLLPYLINHPLRVAERVATQDILSHGRIELGTGRGNTTIALRAFGVSPSENRAQWLEGLRLIKAAFTQDPFSFSGEYFQVPPRSLVPKPVQKPYPPIWVAASSPEAHVLAGEEGIGVISTSGFQGWDYLEGALADYTAAIERTAATGEHVNNRRGVTLFAHCAPTDEQAIAEAGEPTMRYVKLAFDAYPRLAKLSADYGYGNKIAELGERLGTLDYLLNESGSVLMGSPDTWIERIEQLRRMGADEVWLRLDSLPHDQIMSAIELIGRHVIPHFNDPAGVAPKPEDVLDKIRAMRDQEKADEVPVGGG
jgi:alkanesulfonate monooxygenase SsuD/methylene tetrahydromethanopterin reductase-like flavin-dependent oxidoreductase (luciferase family)